MNAKKALSRAEHEETDSFDHDGLVRVERSDIEKRRGEPYRFYITSAGRETLSNDQDRKGEVK